MFDDDGSHEILINGIAAARAKEYDLARHYLEWFLRLEPPLDKRMDALVMMAEIAKDPADRRAYLEEALAIEPSEPRARRLLAVMDGNLYPAQIVDPDRMPIIPAPETPEAADARRFACPNCGGRMVFTPDGQGLACEYCATLPPAGSSSTAPAAPSTVPDGNFTVAMATARGHIVAVQQHVLTCKGCGAVFILPPQQLTLTCPYCESVYVLAEKETRQLVAPSGVIPFGVDEAAARQVLQDWLHSLNKIPAAAVGAVHGLYLPAWSFDVDGQVAWHYRVKVGRNEWSGEEVWKQQEDLVDYRNLLIAASPRLPEACRPELAGYNLKQLAPYDERYLANWPAETYQKSVSDASLDAREYVFKREQEKIRGKLVLQQVSDLAFSSLGIVVEAYKLVLLPAWLAHYTLQGKRYDVIVNGQTGHAGGARPPGGIAGWLGR